MKRLATNFTLTSFGAVRPLILFPDFQKSASIYFWILSTGNFKKGGLYPCYLRKKLLRATRDKNDPRVLAKTKSLGRGGKRGRSGSREEVKRGGKGGEKAQNPTDIRGTPQVF